MRYLFCGCTHLGHQNIIKYCNRPFKDLNEMNETIIKNWNMKVKPEDTVFMVGDFCFKNTINMIHRGEGDIHNSTYYEKQLNGKIIFTRGNHDGNNSTKTCIRNIKIQLGGKLINIVHDPKYVSFTCDFNIVSHVHTLWKFHRFFKGTKHVDAINVGVDQWNFTPLTIEDILKEWAFWKKNYRSTDENRTP